MSRNHPDKLKPVVTNFKPSLKRLGQSQIKNIQGFTLLEVLIASLILFATIAVVSILFKSSFIASEKAQQKLEHTAVVPAVLSVISQEIQEKTTATAKELGNKGQMWGVNYHWQANEVAFKAPPDKFDQETGNTENQDNRYKLWQVELTLGSDNTSAKGNEPGSLQYRYKEVSWLN
ncbi:prepilin-type N-terminal cleavage/methylation domain-containing protein [Thalassotalea euphylliae]|uniref:Prepilin-type N-terminal cleavage/methylation domain-containing protein n=1 Tax=Thalassotalea euphylliae TaxID=1655234 RepID=A0A3E0TNG9_9GAMM|nr:prepilin-type N-terminal cleavage/methylation domain-containing protein [Thalassotalea euphylliae]REL26106.1 prepilin-type N-terminal cleavage/methylation domain-containing protein [Thalassotalea euphylliae]